MFTRIIVPLDGSEYGERALQYVQELAMIAGAHVSLLFVIGSAAAQSGPDVPDLERRRALAYLEVHAQVLREDGLQSVETYVRSGEPASQINDLARTQRANLIVMSTGGLGADGRYAIGSVALRVLTTAPCPIFMVRINRPDPAKTGPEERWQSEGGANVG